MLAPAALQGKVLQGTCGWSDPSIVSCGRFYPRNVKSTADKLQVYSQTFACVEVDSTCYAIASPRNVQKWVENTPPGFKFHFKAFGLFCAQSCPANAIPRSCRERLAAGAGDASQVRLVDLPESVVDTIWDAYHGALKPAKQAGKLGSVLFQFHTTFVPSDKHRRHVEWCRARLDPDIAMAVEFRCREWFEGSDQAPRTLEWLARSGSVLVAADERRDEVPEGAERAAGEGDLHHLMPIAMHVTNPDFFFVRVHRREGTHERFLPGFELDKWVARLEAIAGQLRGPLYFLWGTDYEDAPVVNAAQLQRRLPPRLALDWRAHAKARQGGLAAAFSNVARSAQPAVGPLTGASAQPVSRGGRTAHADRDETHSTFAALAAPSVSDSSGKAHASRAAECMPAIPSSYDEIDALRGTPLSGQHSSPTSGVTRRATPAPAGATQGKRKADVLRTEGARRQQSIRTFFRGKNSN